MAGDIRGEIAEERSNAWAPDEDRAAVAAC